MAVITRLLLMPAKLVISAIAALLQLVMMMPTYVLLISCALIAAMVACWSIKRNRQQKKIKLGEDIWADVIKWIPLRNLSTGLSLTNRRLSTLCAHKLYETNGRIVHMICLDPIGNPFGICSGKDSSWDLLWPSNKQNMIVRVRQMHSMKAFKSDVVEVPTGIPPPNIIGFCEIRIRVLNPQILNFIVLLLPLIRPTLTPLKITVSRHSLLDPFPPTFKILQQFCQLIQGYITSISIGNKHFDDPFWVYFSDFLLSVQYIEIQRESLIVFEEAIAFSHDNKQSIMDWMQTRCENGPRVLYTYICDEPLIRQLREAFERAEHSCSYILQMDIYRLNDNPDIPDPFQLTNEKTGERLELSRVEGTAHGLPSFFVLRRFPAIAASLDDTWQNELMQRAVKLFVKNDRYEKDIAGGINVQEARNLLHLYLTFPADSSGSRSLLDIFE